MKKLIILALFCLLSGVLQAQKQGIRGQVTWSSGNQMPGPDRNNEGSRGIARKIFVYQVTSLEQVVAEDGFYKTINTQLIKIGKSRKNGRFSIKIPIGTYSVFTQEPKGLWANLFNEKNQINTVKVLPGQWTPLAINVNYMAAY
jgi:hypothetical protein